MKGLNFVVFVQFFIAAPLLFIVACYIAFLNKRTGLEEFFKSV